VSALTGEGCAELRAALAERFALPTLSLLKPSALDSPTVS